VTICRPEGEWSAVVGSVRIYPGVAELLAEIGSPERVKKVSARRDRRRREGAVGPELSCLLVHSAPRVGDLQQAPVAPDAVPARILSEAGLPGMCSM
jgi:hypothetical protein